MSDKDTYILKALCLPQSDHNAQVLIDLTEHMAFDFERPASEYIRNAAVDLGVTYKRFIEARDNAPV